METDSLPAQSRATNAPPNATPLMQQYHDLKSRYPQEILLFRLGDFYEMFADDAKDGSAILDLALTHRQQVPMCGVPAHAVDNYIAKLLKAGRCVAIADQMEVPAPGKGLVKREVVRVMTPGTLQEDSLLVARQCNFLVALAVDGSRRGLAAIDCSTGEFWVMETDESRGDHPAWNELARLRPSEVVLEKSQAQGSLGDQLRKNGIAVAELPSSDFSATIADERLKRFFKVQTLRGFGLESASVATSAAGAALRYVEQTQCGRPFTLETPQTRELGQYLQMDENTLRHLDLIGEPGVKSSKNLLQTIDHTLTPMGSRLLRRWLVYPLRQIEPILERQTHLEFFLSRKTHRRSLRENLNGWPDVERIITRLACGTLLPRDLAGLSQGLQRLPRLHAQLQDAERANVPTENSTAPVVTRFIADFPEESQLADLLSRAIVDVPPVNIRDGGVVRAGYDRELDEVRSWVHEGKTHLLEMEKREREATGIGSLKVGFNNIFGYFIEVTKTHLSRVPVHYIRKQTTAGGERFITPELKEFEQRILGAEERALRLEQALLQNLRESIVAKADSVRRVAHAVAELDATMSLAEAAEKRHWVKPDIDDSDTLVIRDGRHPVLEEILPAGTLVANDTDLNGTTKQIVILTGPNMSGKSTYLRQTALITILAQMGSYVPAAQAHIGLIDRLFTRIGASDRLLDGESTFMVEMVETARILNHATSRSLLILDEVGRGTSTYDGISIAWACLEYLNGQFLSSPTAAGGEFFHKSSTKSVMDPRARAAGDDGLKATKPKVLFATHYFELTQLAQQLSGVRNAHVTARERGDDVVFLHKVEEGPADRAYGIHVARLAGVPASVLARAEALLQGFEKTRTARERWGAEQMRLDLGPAADPAVAAPSENDTLMTDLAADIRALDCNATTPLQALLTIQRWKEKLAGREGDHS